MLWSTVVQSGTPRQAETTVEAKKPGSGPGRRAPPACRRPASPFRRAHPRGTHSDLPGRTWSLVIMGLLADIVALPPLPLSSNTYSIIHEFDREKVRSNGALPTLHRAEPKI